MPGHLRVQGLAPLAELVNFQTRLNALTSGQASYTLSMSHHEPVPPNLQQQLVSAYRSQEDE
jgi:elongation factor G